MRRRFGGRSLKGEDRLQFDHELVDMRDRFAKEKNLCDSTSSKLLMSSVRQVR